MNRSRKIMLYAPGEIIPVGFLHTFLLIPFFGIYVESADDPDRGRFSDWANRGGEWYELVSRPDLADFFVLPFGYSFDQIVQAQILNFLELADKYRKTTLLFYNSDDDRPIQHDNVLVYRTSLNKSKRFPYENALPGWSKDFEAYFGDKKWNFLEKDNKARISYCGYVDQVKAGWISSLRSLFFPKPETQEENAKKLRGKLCRVFMANTQIETQFIFRTGFWAGEEQDKFKARKEYAANMIGSHYALAVRGGGNFSYRFYEIMSCGRIPVFLNTDSVLPFEEEIPWREHLLWLEESEIEKSAEMLSKHYDGQNEMQLKELQQSNRTLYEQSLSPAGFFKHLSVQLSQRL